MSAVIAASRPRRLVAILGIAMVLVIAITAALSIKILRDREIETWRGQLGNVSDLLGEQVSQTIFSAYVTLDWLTASVRDHGASDANSFRKAAAAPVVLDTDLG